MVTTMLVEGVVEVVDLDAVVVAAAAAVETLNQMMGMMLPHTTVMMIFGTMTVVKLLAQF
eukprot:12478521-Ditylum_brightwellii.AAC.1